MAQWFEAKAAHPDALVFFRMGDFYELFFEDAEAAAAALDIALTQRGEHAGRPIRMCGVPVHAADAYLARLIRRGFRVAVAEQMEDPKKRVGKGPVRRAVVRLVTPGTLTEDTLLEAARPNLLLALAASGDALGAAWLDISTGLFETAGLAPADLAALLARLDPAEILAPPGLDLGDLTPRRGPAPPPSAPLPSAPQAARRRVAEAFGVASLDAYGTFSDAEAVAASVALDYLRATQAGQLPRLAPPSPQSAATLLLDAATRASLEITRARDGGPHTLLAAVRRTLTAPGARLLADRLAAPLTDPAAITARQDGWSWLLAQPGAAEAARTALKSAPDIARALARLALGRGGPRDLAAIRDGLTAARACADALSDPSAPAELAAAQRALAPDPALADLLARALADPAPARLDDGGAIRPGFDPELDAERALRDDTRRVIAGLQLDLAQRYGVASLKIRHHAQLGYVIEAPTAAVDALRAFPDLVLRQAMANGARFVSPDLADLDRRITEAAGRAAAREAAVFAHVVRAVLERSDRLAACADALAVIDVAQSAARLAEGGAWCRPVVADDTAFRITAGRHPVVEAALSGSARFIANGCDLSPERRVMLLTGPNMAGKSTFLRQNALFVVLAQAGLPLPAEAAEIGICDRLFSRVGAADDLARGRSTFMVEMVETAAILNQAGPRSLVVVDEIGRGTSTLDGLAIAWAVLEALHTGLRCRTIFATHFHELAGLAESLPRLAPHTMRVREWQGSVVFLHEVAPGAASRSWGVHVAELAGVPSPVVRRAAGLLAVLERGGARAAPVGSLPLFAAASAPEPKPPPQSELPAELRDILATLDPDRLTPRAALDLLYRIRATLPVPPVQTDLPSG
jgi:DNA mismatch repair protein MutS